MKKAAIIIIFLIALVLITPVAGQTTPTQVTDNEYDNESPQIAIDSSGNSYLTWYGWDGSYYQIFWAKVDSSGTVAPIVNVSDNEYDNYDPQIAVDSSGNSYLTWHGGGNSQIFLAKVDPSGTVTNTTQVTDNPYDDYRPQIAIDSSGNSYLTWGRYDGTQGDDLFWAKVDPSGTVTDTEQLTDSSDDESDPRIAVDSSGNSYLTWRKYYENDGEVFWAKVDSSGTDPVVTIEQLTDNEYDDYSRNIVADSSGNSYLTWHGEDGNDYEVFWAKVDSSGTDPIVTIEQITDNECYDRYPQIAIDPSGNSYLTWHGWDENNHEIFVAKVDSSGTLIGTEQITDNEYNDKHPNIAVDPSGNSYLTWHGGYERADLRYGDNDGDTSTSLEIFWARVDSSGVVTNIEQLTDNDYDDKYPKIAVDSSGNSYLTWHGGYYEEDVLRYGDNDGDTSVSLDIFFIKMETQNDAKTLINPFAIFKPIANTQLSNANTIWNCIAENLPEEIPAEVQEMIEEAQTHMANATSLSNPIYSNGELVKAIKLMENISEALGCECI